MPGVLQEKYERDRQTWDACAQSYEEHIVGGHPEVAAYEAFEEDLLDRILLYLIRDCGRRVHLFDVGCGSARLHCRYGIQISEEGDLSGPDRERIRALRAVHPQVRFDSELARGLDSIGGLDFSAEMIALAQRKLNASGLESLLNWKRLWLRQGSAFDLSPMKKDPLPVAVTLCNSIGVMQGPEGAKELFRALRRAVEDAGGLALISAYRREAVASHALGNYESTLSVSGQPRWLCPETYASDDYVQIPRGYKWAHDPDPTLTVDVLDREGHPVRRGHTLWRDPQAVARTIQTGEIRTFTDYESNWYGFDQFEHWIEALWPAGKTWHLEGSRLDALRAEPVQLAILDPEARLKPLVERWLDEPASDETE